MALNLIRYVGNRVACDAQIAQAGQRMATAREGMLDRIADAKANGASSDYFHKAEWHPEGTARIGGVNHWCLAKYAPTTHYAKETLEANKAGHYLALTEAIKLGNKPASEVIQMIAERDADKPAEQKRVLIPLDQGPFSVPSQSLGDVDIARFLARGAKLAQAYGKFLKNVGIKDVKFYQTLGDQDIVAGLWLCGWVVGDNSGFVGDDMGFNDKDGFSLGVRSAGAKKSPRYTPDDVRHYNEGMRVLREMEKLSGIRTDSPLITSLGKLEGKL